jgi:hypothetical protein
MPAEGKGRKIFISFHCDGFQEGGRGVYLIEKLFLD